MKNKKITEDWADLSDTPEEFDNAIKNAITPKEKEFFEKLRYKELNETAASNDVLMNEADNSDGLYILRVGSDGILIGKRIADPSETSIPEEYAGIFLALQHSISQFVGRDITLLEWLRERDYKGIKYNRNNDYM